MPIWFALRTRTLYGSDYFKALRPSRKEEKQRDRYGGAEKHQGQRNGSGCFLRRATPEPAKRSSARTGKKKIFTKYGSKTNVNPRGSFIKIDATRIRKRPPVKAPAVPKMTLNQPMHTGSPNIRQSIFIIGQQYLIVKHEARLTGGARSMRDRG